MSQLKTIVLAFLLIGLTTTFSFAQDEKKPATEKEKPAPAPTYNAKLAETLGADEYGMRSYVFVVLKTGKTEIKDPEESKKVFAGHFANMSRLAKEKKLVLAGPFIEGKPKRGMFIFNVTTIKEAEELVKNGPRRQSWCV